MMQQKVRRSPRALAVASCVVCAGILVGCAPAGPNPIPLPPTDSATLSAEACGPDASYPDLNLQELNEALPIKNRDASYMQDEIELKRPAPGCATSAKSETTVALACSLTVGTDEQTRAKILGANRWDVLDRMFADGAERVVSEWGLGHTTTASYRYQMLAWQYPSQEQARASSLFALFDACDGASASSSVGERRVLTENGHVFAVSFAAGDKVYVIESMRGVDPQGKPIMLPDSPLGIVPPDALAVMQEWWQKHALTS